MKLFMLTRQVDGPQIRFWVKDHCVVIEPKPWSQIVPATVIDAIQQDSPELQQMLSWTEAESAIPAQDVPVLDDDKE